jgi:hypothetical protein
MWAIFISEILLHSAFFLVFLTIFYTTFFVFIQSNKLPGELSEIFDDWGYISIMSIGMTKNDIQNMKNYMKDYKPDSGTPDNSELLFTLWAVVSISTLIMVSVSVSIALKHNIDLFTLFYTNCITLLFIAITDVFIVLFFSIFKVIQPGFLIGISAVSNSYKRGGSQPPDCLRLLEDTLEELFPPFKDLIHKQIRHT